MNSRNRALPAGIAAAVVALGVLPLVLYWPSFQRAMDPGCLLTRDAGHGVQGLVAITAVVVKPLYMVLSLAWILWLWRRRARDLVALRWGLIFFLAGEIACAANFLVFNGVSAVTDYLHSYGMAVGFSFIAYAVLEGMDCRLIKYSSAKDRCAALGLCRACSKHADVPCGLRRLFSFLIPALAVIALMLPSAAVSPAALKTKILNTTQDFLSPEWAQIFEGRYCAWVSIVFLLAAWGILSSGRPGAVPAAKIFFAGAMGPLGFGLMRLFLRTAYRENLAWANIWEELTELIFIAGVGFVLWLFRGALFREESPAPADQAEARSTA